MAKLNKKTGDKIMNLGDLHATITKPERRLDLDYFGTWENKINWCIDLAISLNIMIILIPGDLFNSSKANHKVVQNVTRVLKRFKGTIYVIYGQHDMVHHSSNISNTPLKVLHEAGIVTIVSNTQSICLQECVCLYGAGWNEKIPEIINKDGFNILVTHRMIITDKLWEAQEGYSSASSLLRMNDFDLIVSGDNHQSFHVEKDNKTLINCGALMRSTIKEIDHKPCCWVYDLGYKKAKQYLIPVLPIGKVFDLEEIEEEKEKNEELNAFVLGLEKDTEIQGLNYSENVYELAKNAKVKKPVIELIEESLTGE